MMRDELIESFDSLTPAEQNDVLAVYEQCEHRWVQVGNKGFVYQDAAPPKYVVRKSAIVAALANVNEELGQLPSTQEALEAAFLLDVASVGYDKAVANYNNTKRRVKQLRADRNELREFIDELRE